MRFSVIVPIYNVERYLNDCINSILFQNFDDFELVLVVDGSPDSSLDICKSYQKKDGRIKIVNKENGGLVSARKAGTNVAVGDYIVCVDGDDFLEQGYLLEANRIIETYNPDVISFGYLENRSGCRKIVLNSAIPGFYNDVEIGDIQNRFVYDEFQKHADNLGSLIYSLWSKIVKKSLYFEAQMKVPDIITVGEDVICSSLILKKATSLFVSDKSFYNYRILGSSMINAFYLNKFDALHSAINVFKQIAELDEKRIGAYCYRSMVNYVSVLSKQYNKFSLYKSVLTSLPHYKELHGIACSFRPKRKRISDSLKLFFFKKEFYFFFYKYYRR